MGGLFGIGLDVARQAHDAESDGETVGEHLLSFQGGVEEAKQVRFATAAVALIQRFDQRRRVEDVYAAQDQHLAIFEAADEQRQGLLDAAAAAAECSI